MLHQLVRACIRVLTWMAMTVQKSLGLQGNKTMPALRLLMPRSYEILDHIVHTYMEGSPVYHA
jgi:hypothetical protein